MPYLIDGHNLIGQLPDIDKHRVQYGKALDELIAKFDGHAGISEILDVLPYDRDALWFLINKLVDVGCLKSAHRP